MNLLKAGPEDNLLRPAALAMWTGLRLSFGRDGGRHPRAAMTCYVDGNNLIGGGYGSRGEDARPILLNRLLSLRLPKPCVVVFDGPPFAEGGGASGRGAFRLLFSGKRSADDVIAERLRKGDVVVTRDRGLALRARDRQARTVAPKEFLDGLHPLRDRPSSAEKPEPGGDVSEWLAVFGNGK